MEKLLIGVIIGLIFFVVIILLGFSLLPNPASQYCIEKGYKLELRTNPDGSQYAVCVFPDGSECEEWAFYRGECKPGGKK